MRLSPLLLLSSLATTVAMPAIAETVAELLTWCAPGDKGGSPTLCEAYLDSELELLASPDPMSNGGTPACVPAGEDRGRIIDHLRDYARDHPAARNLDSVTAIGLALEGRYPCGWTATPAPTQTFARLLTWCAPADEGGDSRVCMGHLNRELQLLASPNPLSSFGARACVPEGEDRGRIISLMRNYARDHPSARSLSMREGLGLALKDRFPCSPPAPVR